MVLLLSTLLAASATVSLTVDVTLKCPAPASLTERMARVGLSVLPPSPQTPQVTELLARPSFEVSIKPTAGGLLLTTRRTSDGKVFERTVETGREDCPTVERLVVVLIHSWITSKMPVLSPHGLDGGSRR
ncbi:MAG: hypothetical protein IPJ65_01860 [Archangiaceae bacterium]|nr:hypothetical protein [Archangiaceae bacterium]